MASILVAGATGAIGRNVVRLAISNFPESGIEKVVALTRQKPSTATPASAIFGLADNTGVDKMNVVTFDWEHFFNFWIEFSRASLEEQKRLHEGSQEDSEVKTTEESNVNQLRTLQTDYNKYKLIFSGHQYAAICLGTTKKDAGGMKQFRRCDYSYVLAFTEALLCFSGPAGWDGTGDRTAHSKEKDGKKLSWTCPSWISYQVQNPDLPSDQPWVSTNAEAQGKFLNYYKQNKSTVSLLKSRSSKTLQGVALVSSSGASPSSWIGYLQTKGATEEGVAERVTLHNHLHRFNESASDSDGKSKKIRLSVLRPGLLSRGDKARFNETIANVLTFNSGIKVEVCAAAILKSCIGAIQGKDCVDRYGEPYPDRKAFQKANQPFFIYGNSNINKVVESSHFS